MKQKIYIPQPIAAAGEDYLIEKGYEIVRGSGKTDKESIKNDIAVCDAMIQRTAKVDKEILEAGKTLGIIGLGKIGKEVARKAALGLDMRVISYVPRPEGKDIPEYIEIVSWEELLQTSDYISLHVPGGEKNQGIISKKEFAMMKKSASLIQVSRGGVVDEEALAEAIRNSQIRGAAVDVFSEEPPKKDNPLLKLEQVILTPHIGSNTVECMDRIALDVAEDVHLVLSGENPKHPIKR